MRRVDFMSDKEKEWYKDLNEKKEEYIENFLANPYIQKNGFTRKDALGVIAIDMQNAIDIFECFLEDVDEERGLRKPSSPWIDADEFFKSRK